MTPRSDLDQRKRWNRPFSLRPPCPICGQRVYIKTMELHILGHRPERPTVADIPTEAERTRGLDEP